MSYYQQNTNSAKGGRIDFKLGANYYCGSTNYDTRLSNGAVFSYLK